MNVFVSCLMAGQFRFKHFSLFLTVLGLEGTVAQRVCVIKEGSCLLRKVLSVLSTNHDGKKVSGFKLTKLII